MVTTDFDLTAFRADSVASGLTVTQDALLDGIVADGVAYIDQVRVTITGETNGFTASKDTYVDVNASGTFTYVEAVIDAAAPALTADSIRIAMVQTDATTIVAITDMRTMATSSFVFGVLTMTGTSMEIYNAGRSPVQVRHDASSTSEGMPIAPYTSRTVAETVYLKPTGSGGLISVTQ